MKKSFIYAALLAVLLTGCQSSSGASGDAVVSQTPEPSAHSDASPSPAPAATEAPAPTPGSTSAAQAPAQGQMGKVSAVRLADAKRGWTGGDGWIARTDDGGAHWQAQFRTSGEVRQIFALNDQEAWAVVGDQGELLATSDGGKHWSKTGKLPNQGFLHFVSKQEAYSANAKTVDGGQSWSQLAVPSSIVGDAYFHDKNNGWAVQQVGDQVQVQRTQDGGLTWKQVMSRQTVDPITGAVIRSAGANDAWVELIGGSGMTQTSYSLFHTEDGGKAWQTVIAKTTAGGGPAPGFPLNYLDGPDNAGSGPGPLYVASPKVAYMGGACMACGDDGQYTVGWTKDGGQSWVNGKSTFAGHAGMLLAIADAASGWLITSSDNSSAMYTTSDGGVTWKQVHTFAKTQ